LDFSAKVGRKAEKKERRQKETVCRRDLGFLEDRSMVSMKKLLDELSAEDGGSGYMNVL